MPIRMWSKRKKARSSDDPYLFPLSTILKDERASKELHLYLLGGLNKDQFKTIPAGGRNFIVGVVEVNPAPTISDSNPTQSG